MILNDLFLINETLDDWSSTWVHYTNFEDIKLNVSSRMHQDPVGIYLFPEKFKPAPMWLLKKNKFRVTLKPNARILDFGKITDEQLTQLLQKTGSKKAFEIQMNEYPPENIEQKLRMAWGAMRYETIKSNSILTAAGWNKAIRECGWDAIFDDLGVIHQNEVQLLLLNPSIIASIQKEIRLDRSGFKALEAMSTYIKNLCQEYGQAEIDKPKQVRNRLGKKRLRTHVITKDDAGRYADVEIEIHKDSGMINIFLCRSHPELHSFSIATYNTLNNEWEVDLNDFEKDLAKIFEPTDAQPKP